MKTNRSFVPVICFCLILALPAKSQDSTTAAKDTTTQLIAPDTIAFDPFMSFMMLNFEFERPDSSFIKMSNVCGFENEAGARVTYQLFPAPFANVVKDFSKKKLTGADSVLIQKKASVNAVNGYLVKVLYRSPDAQHEDHIGIFFLFPYQTGTINMVAVYPRSLDPVVYANILKSFGTVREVRQVQATVKN